MSVHVIVMKEGRKLMRPILDRKEYISLRDSEANRKADKKHMLQMNYSCLPNEDGGLKGATRMSTTIGADIDVPVDTDFVLSKKEELGLLMFENSATKPGCGHVVCRRKDGLTQEENLRRISDILGVEYDKGAKDITRVFYTPADKLVYLDDEIFKIEEANDIPAVKTMPEPTEVKSEEVESEEVTDGEEITYHGIPYKDIIRKWWEIHYGGHEPIKNDRNTLTYELAVNLRHICNFDRNLMDKVIPCYDGFPEKEKQECIANAIAAKPTQMPKRLTEVLVAIRQDLLNRQQIPESAEGESAVKMLNEALLQDDLFYYNRIPKNALVQGLKESLDAAGHQLAMPTIIVASTCIGARATHVELDVHGKPNTLNLIGYVAGDAASNKGQMDDIVDAWMSEDMLMTEVYNKQWDEYCRKKRAAKNSKQQPEEPCLPKKILSLNNTTANLAAQLQCVDSEHAFSFTPEADVVAQKWKSTVSDFSTMIRQAYDASRYDREIKSTDSQSVHIAHLRWNVVMCGTPDALYRVVDNYTDGMQSRIAVARTPDNTFTPLEENPAHMTPTQKMRIEQVSHLLPLLHGTITLPKVEARGRLWLEEIRLGCMKNNDVVMARQRMRICVTAQRLLCCLMLSATCAHLIKKHGWKGAEMHLKEDPSLWQKVIRTMQTPAFLDLFDVIADSLIDNAMYFFRERIDAAINSKSYRGSTGTSGSRTRKGKNDSIYERLSSIFTMQEALQQAIAIKGITTTENAVQQMLKNWVRQGIIALNDEGNYTKIK